MIFSISKFLASTTEEGSAGLDPLDKEKVQIRPQLVGFLRISIQVRYSETTSFSEIFSRCDIYIPP